MRRRTLFVVAATLTIGFCGTIPFAVALQGGEEQEKFQQLSRLPIWARQALSENTAVASEAISSLRKSGPAGLEVLLETHQELLERGLKLSPAERAADEPWQRLQNALDKVGGQRDNWSAKLFWHTDLETARAQAAEEKKPILSLRLLGNLDEELSCANSRFFRTALYPNAAINKELREKFVLHWQSVRPVPKVTIDFGDGRKIQTTITGNSIHYTLDSQGRVLDALPGLYAPRAFRQWLTRMEDLNAEVLPMKDAERSQLLRRFHEQRLEQVTREWQMDVGRAGVPLFNLANSSRPEQKIQQRAQAVQRPQPPILTTPNVAAESSEIPTARTAAPLAVTKSVFEMPVLQSITSAVPRDRTALAARTDDAMWARIANMHRADAALDESSLAVLRSKTPRARAKTASFQQSIAEDSVRNEYLRHPTIHQWLAADPEIGLDKLNQRVYSEIFLTPDADPWLGLLPNDAYSAIANDGVVAPK